MKPKGRRFSWAVGHLPVSLSGCLTPESLPPNSKFLGPCLAQLASETNSCPATMVREGRIT